ncbi:PREDICTED: uncharacterized protein LOC105564172 [Vollenhovia emeryi]|uniref:uncharacterized protein LOC105564172 n=1 Tax=Vollenhovia emeryi TaxID=411798 RepID=UPI0005F39673|nr:PREDICTED: uncharacterized protein LOC105564172 [Vollenhovia emeryi]
MADNIAVASASFIVLYNLLKKKKKTRKQRRWWSTQLYLTRRRVNNINIFLWNDSLADKESDQFKNFPRMSEEDFIKIFFNSIKEKISKNDTTFRKAVPVEERLAVTLRYLTTGDSFTSLQYLFKISKQLISQIVPEVCQAIIDCLISYEKMPLTPDEWKKIAKEFEETWNFPHCIGAVGKLSRSNQWHHLIAPLKPYNFRLKHFPPKFFISKIYVCYTLIDSPCISCVGCPKEDTRKGTRGRDP